MSLFRKIHAGPSDAASDRIEYIVRPHNDTWLIEHAGDRYGPYKDHREAMLFAIDAARKLGALGKNTGVKMIDRCGHLLTTWNYGDRHASRCGQPQRVGSANAGPKSCHSGG